MMYTALPYPAQWSFPCTSQQDLEDESVQSESQHFLYECPYTRIPYEDIRTSSYPSQQASQGAVPSCVDQGVLSE